MTPTRLQPGGLLPCQGVSFDERTVEHGRKTVMASHIHRYRNYSMLRPIFSSSTCQRNAGAHLAALPSAVPQLFHGVSETCPSPHAAPVAAVQLPRMCAAYYYSARCAFKGICIWADLHPRQSFPIFPCAKALKGKAESCSPANSACC